MTQKDTRLNVDHGVWKRYRYNSSSCLLSSTHSGQWQWPDMARHIHLSSLLRDSSSSCAPPSFTVLFFLFLLFITPCSICIILCAMNQTKQVAYKLIQKIWSKCFICQFAVFSDYVPVMCHDWKIYLHTIAACCCVDLSLFFFLFCSNVLHSLPFFRFIPHFMFYYVFVTRFCYL